MTEYQSGYRAGIADAATHLETLYEIGAPRIEAVLDGGGWRGWLAAIDELERLAKEPK